MIEDFLEVRLHSRDDFLKIAETLTRVGISSKDKTLTQTCHILHKRGLYYIVHFKELFKLDGVGKTDLSDEDVLRRNGVAKLLAEWGLCEIVDPEKFSEGSINKLKIVPFREKKNYQLKSNYTIGVKK